MIRRPLRLLLITLAVIMIALIVGRAASVFYTEALWYDALGHGDVFWKRITAAVLVSLVTGASGAAIIMLNLWYVIRQVGPVHLRRRYGNIEIAEQVPRRYLVAGAAIASAFAGWWLSLVQFGGGGATAVLAALQAPQWGVSDPLFGRDLSFYIFALPVWVRLLELLLIVLLWSVLLVAIGYVLVGAVRVRGTTWHVDERPRLHFAWLFAALLATFGVHLILSRYGLLLEGNGFNSAIGYTDVHARLPARMVLGVLSFVTAGAVVWGAMRRSLLPPLIATGLFLVVALGMGLVYPAIVQKVQVEPNQLARELRFIRWNMEFTRAAYGLDAIERTAFSYRRPDPTAWDRLAPALAQLPLWDQEPLQTLYNEIQAGDRYYTFPDVDYDRYPTPSGPEHVAIGVREFDAGGLPPTSVTWQSIHLNPLYTRGMGVIVTPTVPRRRGDPVHWISDGEPIQVSADAPPSLRLTEPSIFFGETMEDYAVVGHIGRFSGEDADSAMVPVPTVETGVPLSSFMRVLAFSIRFGAENLLFSGELGDTSRILYYRTIRDRVERLAPFLHWDTDPHPVVLDGRVVWLIDGYTVSPNYPLSRPYAVPGYGGLRYIRSAVKATVDAVSGAVTLYTLPEPDPIIRAYAAVFPGLFTPSTDLPEGLRMHVRYPAQLFRTQADLLKDYHLDRPEMFYAGQDIWELPLDDPAQEGGVFRPEYLQLPMPGSTEAELLLMYPFIARQRQNLTAILIARSDPPHYGELVLLEMPRDDEIRGPGQIQSIIQQDPVVSQQLTLWQRQGSNAHLGRLRMIPTENSLLYVRPLFLSARERGIPQLQRVIVTDASTVAMADDLPSAIAALQGNAPRDTTGAADPGVALPGDDVPAADWQGRAAELVRRADEALRAGDFAAFGAAWNELKLLLEGRAGSTP